MAFIKFKPLTPKFNFYKEITDYPKYIYDYIDNENIIFAYRTRKMLLYLLIEKLSYLIKED